MFRFSSLFLLSIGLFCSSMVGVSSRLISSRDRPLSSLSSISQIERTITRLESQLEKAQETLASIRIPNQEEAEDEEDDNVQVVTRGLNTAQYELDSASAADLSFPNPLHINPPTVPALNVASYLGAWYEVYADAVVLNTFQKNSYCAQAHYNLLPNGKVGVYNSQTVGSATGKYGDIMGTATTSTTPGKLSVELQGGAPFPADYWVLALGPLNQDNLYDYAIVSDRLEATLFVLARDPQQFQKLYQAQVLQQLDTLGFNKFYNNPQVVYQGTSCIYASNQQVQNAFDTLIKENPATQ